MRILTLLALGIFLVAGSATPVAAQTPAAAEPAPKFFFNVRLGGQSRDQTFTESSTFNVDREPGAIAAAHSIGGGTLFNVSAAARVWRDAGVGIAYSTLKNKNDAAVSVRVPHPLIFGQPRTATATASALEHSENVIHLQFMWIMSLTDKFQIAVMAGPSFFTVRQTVATVRVPQDIQEGPGFTSVTISNVTLTDVKDSPVGAHIGVDGTYLIRTIGGLGIGVGGFVRYIDASFDLPVAEGVTRDTDLKAGGPQGAIGLRLQF